MDLNTSLATISRKFGFGVFLRVWVHIAPKPVHREPGAVSTGAVPWACPASPVAVLVPVGPQTFPSALVLLRELLLYGISASLDGTCELFLSD